MKKALLTIFLLILALLGVAASVLLFVDGSLARLTGWYHFQPGMSLFPPENLNHMDEVSWMRISDLHDTIECKRTDDGTWWVMTPFRDRMAPEAVEAILSFAVQARLVDTLPLNRTTRASMREFGVETSPHTITLKKNVGKHDMTTLARFTLGSASPWLSDAGDGEHLLPTTYLRTDFYGRDKRIHVVSGNILSIFRNGLQGLRDAHPLHIKSDSVLEIEVLRHDEPESSAKKLKMTRASAQSHWSIVSPTLTEADEEKAEMLLALLDRLRAVRIEEVGDVRLPPEPMLTLTLTLENGEKEELRVYKPFSSSSDGQQLCYATTADRPVVFTLPVEPRMHRSGGYAKLVNEILSLPVLPASVQTQVQNSINWVYWDDLPITLSDLRSKRFSHIAQKDIDKVLVRSVFSPYPLILRLIPGDQEGQTKDVWMFSVAGRPFEEADEEVVSTFLNGLGSIPVLDFLHDLKPDDSPLESERKFGLMQPDYLMLVQPRECAVRAVLFGEDLPLVRDRAPRIFRMKRQRAGNDIYWAGMEQNTFCVYKLSPKLMKLFSFSPESWRKRNLTQFPISALRTLSLHYMKTPLVLHYDYIGEEWTGTLGTEDVTPRINPHRTNHFVHHLQQMRVRSWLPKTDEDALAALKDPVFTIQLQLEITDYSDLESIVMDAAQQGDAASDRLIPPTMEEVRDMLTEKNETDAAFRKIATGERKVEKRSVTIEVAPSDSSDKKPIFYGRIRENGRLFTLSYEDAQSLDGQLLD